MYSRIFSTGQLIPRTLANLHRLRIHNAAPQKQEVKPPRCQGLLACLFQPKKPNGMVSMMKRVFYSTQNVGKAKDPGGYNMDIMKIIDDGHIFKKKKKHKKPRIAKLKPMNILDLTNVIMTSKSPGKMSSAIEEASKKKRWGRRLDLAPLEAEGKVKKRKKKAKMADKINKHTKFIIRQLPYSNEKSMKTMAFSVSPKAKPRPKLENVSLQAPMHETRRSPKVNNKRDMHNTRNTEYLTVSSLLVDKESRTRLPNKDRINESSNQLSSDIISLDSSKCRNKLNASGELVYAEHFIVFPKPKLKINKDVRHIDDGNYFGPKRSGKLKMKKKPKVVTFKKVENPKRFSVLSSKMIVMPDYRKKKKVDSKSKDISGTMKQPKKIQAKKPEKKMKDATEDLTKLIAETKYNRSTNSPKSVVRNKLRVLEGEDNGPKLSKKDFVLAFVSPNTSQNSKFKSKEV